MRNQRIPFWSLKCDVVEYEITKNQLSNTILFYKILILKYPKVNASGKSIDDIDKSVLKINVNRRQL